MRMSRGRVVGNMGELPAFLATVEGQELIIKIHHLGDPYLVYRRGEAAPGDWSSQVQDKLYRRRDEALQG